MSEKRTRMGKEMILEEAEKLFTEHGYQSVSIRTIADQCGVTNAALYYHFDDKAALFLEVMKRHTHRLSERLRQAGEGFDSSQKRITAMAKEYMDMVSNQRPFMFLIRHHGKEVKESGPPSQFIDMVKEVLAPFDVVLDQAVADGEVRPFPEGYSGASILIGMIHGLSGIRRIKTGCTIGEEDIERIVDYFWHGIMQRS
jgi:AcrR family transcriptional regulator